MKKSERTRQFIIEATAPIFNSKGFDGTSLSDLTEATGLTKGAIYGNFSDKEEIAAEAFRYAMQKVREMVRLKLDAADTSAGKLYALFDFYASYVFDPPVPGGCPLLNTAIEADDHRLSMRGEVAKELVGTVNFIAALIRQGIRSGEFVSTANPRQMAYTVFCAIEGALMFARAERSREPMDIVVKHCKKLVEQIRL